MNTILYSVINNINEFNRQVGPTLTRFSKALFSNDSMRSLFEFFGPIDDSKSLTSKEYDQIRNTVCYPYSVEEAIEIIRPVSLNTSGKTACIVLLAAVDCGIIYKPSYSIAVKAFGVKGSRSGFYKYIDDTFSQEDSEKFRKILLRRLNKIYGRRFCNES